MASTSFKFSDFSYIYLLFAVIRILVTIMPQPGYVHPDEYFQSIDVLLGNQDCWYNFAK